MAAIQNCYKMVISNKEDLRLQTSEQLVPDRSVTQPRHDSGSHNYFPSFEIFFSPVIDIKQP